MTSLNVAYTYYYKLIHRKLIPTCSLSSNNIPIIGTYEISWHQAAVMKQMCYNTSTALAISWAVGQLVGKMSSIRLVVYVM
jgi:hypothetical protein